MNKRLLVVALVVLGLLLTVAAIGATGNLNLIAGNGPCQPGWTPLPGGANPPGWSAACGGPQNVLAGNGPCQPGWTPLPGGPNPPGWSVACGGPGGAG